MRREYNVVRGAGGDTDDDTGFDEFIAAVNEALGQGWQLEGGIAFSPLQFVGVLLAQAVSREVKE